MNQTNHPLRSNRSRQRKDRAFVWVCMAAASVSLVSLAALLLTILIQGLEYLDGPFLIGTPSRSVEKAGMFPQIMGSVIICIICAMAAIPVGVGTAILLEEFQPKQRWARKAHGFIQLNITNLAGVPSVVYGILGLTAFVLFFGLGDAKTDLSFELGVTHYDEFYDLTTHYVAVEVPARNAPSVEARTGLRVRNDKDKMIELTVVEGKDWLKRRKQFKADHVKMEKEAYDQAFATEFAGCIRSGTKAIRTDEKAFYYFRIPLGRGVLAGGLTLALVVLPVIIIASQESLRAVPNSLRHGTLALGCTKWQMVWKMTLPCAIPGIMTGSILAMSRAIGEAAPILIIAGVVYITFSPANLMDDFTAMPLQIYNWASRPQVDFHHLAASGIIVLLAILLTFNVVAVVIRQKTQKSMN